MDSTTEKRDVDNLIKLYLQQKQFFACSEYHYKEINNNCIPPTNMYPTDIDRHQIKIYSWLRLGHKFITQNYLFRRDAVLLCSRYNTSVVCTLTCI